MQRALWTALISMTVAGCGGSDRDDDLPPSGGGGGDDGEVTGDEGGDDGDPGDGTGSDEGGDDGDPGDGGPSDTGGDAGTDEDGTDDPGDPPGGDDPAADTPPDCNPYWSLWPSYGSAEPPTTREEMWCYINRNRAESYATHGRSNGPDEAGDGSVTWPLAMGWDKDLMGLAQAEAERIAGGGAPMGVLTGGPAWGAKNLWIAGNNTVDYILATTDDYITDWWDPTPCCHDPSPDSGISTGNGAARGGLYYHDSSGAGPVLTIMGVGLVEDANGARTWVVKLAP